MLNLGFTIEELMFPENYQSNILFNKESDCLIDKFDEISSTYENQEKILIDEDDWFTIKQLNPNLSSSDNNINLLNDQTLSLTDVHSNNCNFGQVELDSTITALFLPNLSIKVSRDKNNSSTLSTTSPPSCDQLLLNSTNTMTQYQSKKQMMSKSTSSLSFSTQSSTSMASSSTDDMSPNSNDLNEIAIIHHSTESIPKLSYHHKTSHSINDDSSNFSSGRRRRKRTIFSAADIEYLKEAFIQNPKPSQQDIAILSEQLGHDSYVIRVWFYNKRQATKKTK
ncbi:unnamed protein product [Adineta steineri]|uniref:Homeobox domain-containing protein n=3 Tax=Adineta steineri TaxID=433720 RepID=A0A818GI33_9BILA|nr:unnamed protein product [Adineta steineri]CAF3489681.1 unnamed protein product [Adineta steineri]CAF3541765.1 unnamed protein product [Adineta steineri]